MKRFGFCLLLAATLMRAHAQGYMEKDIHFRYAQYLVSGNLFDGGFGLEGTVRRWQWDRLGWGLSLGLDNLDFKPDAEAASETRGGSSVSGSAGYLPLQATLLYKAVDGDPLRLNLESGLRYMVGLTSADVVADIGNTTSKRPIDIADSIVAVAAAHLEYRREPGAGAITLSVGYQQDLVQGEYSVSDFTTGNVELSGPFVALGMAFDL